MTSDATGTTKGRPGVDGLRAGIGVLVAAGMVAAVGAIVGLALTLHSTVVECSAGSSATQCFAHRQVGLGSSLAIVSIILLLVIIALGMLLRAAIEAWSVPKPTAGVPLSELATEVTP